MHSVDKAVSSYAGTEWNSSDFAEKKIEKAQLKLLALPSKTLSPGSVGIFVASGFE